MRALQISNLDDNKMPYAELIVRGKKSWEIRNRNTKIRGKIGIVFDSKLLGTVELIDVVGPMMPEDLVKFPYHLSTLKRMKKYSKGKPLYAWVLRNAKKLKNQIKINLKFKNRYDWIEVKYK